MIERAVGAIFELVIWSAYWEAINRQNPCLPTTMRQRFEDEWRAHHQVRLGYIAIPWTYTVWEDSLPAI